MTAVRVLVEGAVALCMALPPGHPVSFQYRILPGETATAVTYDVTANDPVRCLKVRPLGVLSAYYETRYCETTTWQTVWNGQPVTVPWWACSPWEPEADIACAWWEGPGGCPIGVWRGEP